MGLLDCLYPCCLGELRHAIIAFSFIGINIAYCHRTVLSIGIVEMNGGITNDSSTICTPPSGSGSSTISNIGGGDVGWSNTHQSLILGSFYIGYMIMHIPSGIATDRYGPRWLLIISSALSTTITAITPLVSSTLPWWTICVLRMLLGAAQGFDVPGFAALIGNWIPPQERASATAIVYSAGSIGSVMGNLVTGMMIRGLENWTYPFYLWALLGACYSLGCYFYLYSSPSTDPYITEMELNYLRVLMPAKTKTRIPTKAILSDACIYGLISAQIGHNLVLFTLLNHMPKYLNNVLGFNIFMNALSSLLYIGQLVCGMLSGVLSDYLVKRNANVTVMRKSCSVLSNVAASLFLLLAGEFRCNYVWALVCFGLSIFWKGMFLAGMKVNIIDITVNHNGLIMSIVNGMGAISGVLSSHLVAYIVPENTHVQWRYLFIVIIVSQIVTSVMYVAMSNSSRRKWDYPSDEALPEHKKADKWYLQMTPSDHQLRLETNAKVRQDHRDGVAEQRQKYRDALQAKKEVRRLKNEARRAARGADRVQNE